jgi:hypothetical protein
MSKKLTGRAHAKFEASRDVWQTACARSRLEAER